MKILGTGLSGLVGSRIVELLSDRVEFEHSDVDITDEQLITEKIKSSDASFVLHLAAKARVDACELDRDQKEEGEAWKMNVLGTKNVANACSFSGKKIIYISTDFVFDGEKSPYDENSIPNPLNWYGQTKLLGEKVIISTKNLSWIIARIAFPYRCHFKRNDFVSAIIELFKKNQPVVAVTDQIFTPTFIDDLAEALFVLLQKNEQGVFHIVGSLSISPYNAALLIAKKFDFDSSLMTKTTREEFFKNRAKRPFRLELKNDKIAKLGVKMSTFEEGLKRLKEQL